MYNKKKYLSQADPLNNSFSTGDGRDGAGRVGWLYAA